MFQEEIPVWHTIDCNVLPKKHMGSEVRQENLNMEIVMVTDSENNDSELEQWYKCTEKNRRESKWHVFSTVKEHLFSISLWLGGRLGHVSHHGKQVLQS